MLAALSRSMSPDGGPLAGLVLSDGLRPHARLLEMLGQTTLPVILSPMDSYTIAQRIHSMTVKTLPGDTRKIERIQDLIQRAQALPSLLGYRLPASRPSLVLAWQWYQDAGRSDGLEDLNDAADPMFMPYTGVRLSA